jgi:hypothetical protein
MRSPSKILTNYNSVHRCNIALMKSTNKRISEQVLLINFSVFMANGIIKLNIIPSYDN